MKRGTSGPAADETLPQDAGARVPVPDETIDAAAALAVTEHSQMVPPPSESEDSEIPPGLYSRFEAFEFLGRGGMGAVYKARDLRLGREVAIKLLFGADPELGGSMLREARSQARIAHEHVCEVYEAGTIDRVRYIVMQLIVGEPLDVARASMTLEEKVRVIRQVASALHEAHRIGLVHRDVKPSNIMVERGEDGAFQPYIMDFGLAREMGDSGGTVSGALMGTPSFMAPEQAAGKVRSLDRRTDVYCLGATLYDVILGRPPLVVEGLAPLLQAIMHEDPIPPRQIDRDLPLDLDAIVMKCLEKHPARRYDSAKALGDDLQRFLDGEPVYAMKRAWAYSLYRRAKRHKWKLSIGSVALVISAVFVGGWMSERARAEKQATLSRELGESVKEMEFFLRNAQGMPLHDLDRERNIVRARLRMIESAMSAAGAIGVGPSHYALGRGHLALQEPLEALLHLRAAEAAGYRAAGLDYAMGMALGEIYQKELADTKRMEGEQKKQRIAAIEAEYKAPALAHLKAALGGTIEAPSYAEGLIAFYEGRNEDALAKAREGFEKAPWLYEAKKLEGDVLFEIGKKFGHDAAFDYEKMSKWFGDADGAYRVAAEIGSSDPSVYLSMCELQTQRMNGEHSAGKVMRPSFEEANASCGKAIASSPASGLGYLKLAQAHASLAWRVTVGDSSSGDPDTVLDEAIRRAEEAAKKNPEDPMARYVVASVWRTRALHASNRGLDVVPAVDRAIEAYDEALRLDPRFVWALNEICASYLQRSWRELAHGVDPRASIERGSTYCDQAIGVDSTFTYARITKLVLQLPLAEQRVAEGKSPKDVATEAERLLDDLQKSSPGSVMIHYYRAIVRRIEATYLLDAGDDPTPALEQLEESAKAYALLAPASTVGRELRGEAAAIRARHLLLRGEDPSRSVADARESFGKAMKEKPWDVEYRIWGAMVETLGLRWALRHDEASEAQFDAALAPLIPLLDVERANPELYRALGEIHEMRAAFRLRRGEDPTREIDDGISRVTQALSIHPRMAKALAGKARLLLLRAATSKNRPEKLAAAKMAAEAFSAAVRDNPLLERQERQGIEEAGRIAKE